MTIHIHKIKFQKGDRLLNISQTVVDPNIFSQIVVYDHFDSIQLMDFFILYEASFVVKDLLTFDYVELFWE